MATLNFWEFDTVIAKTYIYINIHQRIWSFNWSWIFFSYFISFEAEYENKKLLEIFKKKEEASSEYEEHKQIGTLIAFSEIKA